MLITLINKIQESNYLNHLAVPSFERVNRLFVLSFKNNTNRTVRTWYYISKVKIKDYVMVEDWSFFEQPIRNNIRTYDNNRKPLVKGMTIKMVTYLMIMHILKQPISWLQ